MKRFTTVFLMLWLAQSALAIEEQVNVGIMEVWVKVTNGDGKAISDLSSEEFKLFIDDKQVELRCFDKTFVDSATVANEPPGRKFIFFFDLHNTMPGDMDFLKNNITRFIQDSFTDKDQAMIFALTPNFHLGIVQKMTSDRQALVSVIRRMRGNAGLRASQDLNEKQILDLLYPMDTTVDDSNPLADKGIGTRPNEFVRNAQSLARSLASQEEARSRLTLNSFVSIGSYLSEYALKGSVALIYISGGFPIRPGEQYYAMIDKAIEDRYTVDSGYLMLMERPRLNFHQDIRRTTGFLNRMNVTIYSLDAKGLLTQTRGAERDGVQAAKGMNNLAQNYQLQDSLALISNETGGVAFLNGQNYQRGLSEIVRDMNEQYLLCGSIPVGEKGTYHEIKVKVSRPGVDVRHRKGYVD